MGRARRALAGAGVCNIEMRPTSCAGRPRGGHWPWNGTSNSESKVPTAAPYSPPPPSPPLHTMPVAWPSVGGGTGGRLAVSPVSNALQTAI